MVGIEQPRFENNLQPSPLSSDPSLPPCNPPYPRRLALGLDIPTVTTLAGCQATVAALRAMRSGPLVQVPIQDYFPGYVDDSMDIVMGNVTTL